MLTIQRAKTLQGKLVLPPSPDLFCVAAFASVAFRRPVRIHPVKGSPGIQFFADLLGGHAAITWEEDVCCIDPLPEPSAAAAFIFESDVLPWRDLIVFLALGTQKPVLFRNCSTARLEAWRAQAGRIGFKLNSVEQGGFSGLVLVPPTSDQPFPATVSEDDIHALLGLLSGLRAKRSFQVDYTPATPFRSLIKSFGFALTVKRDQGGVEKDPLIRRMRLQAGQRLSSQDQLFTITVDFSGQQQDVPVDILLPGDEALLGLFIVAKALFHKGSFVIDNAPLDPWALPVLSLLRKMGGKPSQQETHQTAFGAAGMLSFQKFDLTGQKTECKPLYHYTHQLPAMVLITVFAEGQSIFRSLEDLRLSEPDSLKQLEACLSLMNAKFGDMPDGFVVKGGNDYDGFDMIEPLPPNLSGAFAIAGLCCMGSTTINDDLLALRWPMFKEWLETLFEYRT